MPYVSAVVRSAPALLLVGRLSLAAAELVVIPEAAITEGVLASDNECESGGASHCAVNALQLSVGTSRKERVTGSAVQNASEISAGNRSAKPRSGQHSEWWGNNPDGILHYRRNCWGDCQGAGLCEWFCGKGNACCRYGHSKSDPPECTGVKYFPVLHIHTCVKSTVQLHETPTIYKDPALFKPSSAPVMDFYMYRVQTDEDYNPENQNLGNLGGVLWYLHNEIVWHPNLMRSGTYFATKKTRVERFRVKVRATQPLFNLGMNFGVVNEFDWARCTGPYGCTNFGRFGFTVGCEAWNKTTGNDFPHSQWNELNMYPGAAWYSLPGVCPSGALHDKSAGCRIAEPGGACKGIPTGEGNCTYSYEKVGDISIDELEGLDDPEEFVQMGGQEYNRTTDMGNLMDFWDDISNETANQNRIDQANALFAERYPEQPDLADPPCDFDKRIFFPGRFSRWPRR